MKKYERYGNSIYTIHFSEFIHYFHDENKYVADKIKPVIKKIDALNPSDVSDESIIKSTKVKELWAQGDTVGAQKAADEAKKWAIWGAVAAAVVWVLYVIFFVFIGLGGAFAGY